jgi:maleamate amidohydrolase
VTISVAAGTAPAPRVGGGTSPALLLVDLARGWTDASSPMAGSFDAVVAAAAELLATARARSLPVAFTTVAYDDEQAELVLLLRKTPRVKTMRPGSRWIEIDPRIAPRAAELVLVKQQASSFFETALDAWIAEHRVDTLVIGGCITSGCVRTTAVDAAQRGIRALVVRDATGDRDEQAHEAALRTVDDLYGDVLSLEQAIAYLAGPCAG